MKIVTLTAENVKRLKAVQITPDGNTVVISGRNGQGKTSVLDSIWYALGGGPAAKDTTRPIRDGEKTATVTLDLGELRVTRTWTGDRTALRVESADGARYTSPQQMLDGLVGRLSFDPLAFAHLPEREQLATLLDLVDLPFVPAELDAKRRALYDERTAVGRDGRHLEGRLTGLPEPAEDLPAEEISAAEILAEEREARQQHERYAADARSRATLTDRVTRLQQELAAAEADLAAMGEPTDPATLPDFAAFEDRINAVEETNRQVRAARERAVVDAALKDLREQYAALTADIVLLDERKATAIRDAAMPIDGLAFDDDGVTYRGVPFKQCSAAEQLRVSLAMAMALNPTIRVIRITDGSLLDSDNMRLIEEMATAGDFQVWVERVDESGTVGVYIEDGQVANVPAKAAAS